MIHIASPEFWRCYHALPVDVRALADKSFGLLKADPCHPSLHLKRTGRFWSVRVGLRYRALGVDSPHGTLWFWLGTHAEYDHLLG